MDSYKKKLLIIQRQPPYGNSNAQEAFELLLAANAFDYEVSALFIDDGVWQLQRDQQPQLIEKKSIGAQLQALPVYEIKNIYAEKNSLQQRGLPDKDLVLTTTVLTETEVATLTATQDIVLSF